MLSGLPGITDELLESYEHSMRRETTSRGSPFAMCGFLWQVPSGPMKNVKDAIQCRGG